jgi:hypothetical protein
MGLQLLHLLHSEGAQVRMPPGGDGWSKLVRGILEARAFSLPQELGWLWWKAVASTEGF